MRRLGLLGGMSWESTALYYRLLNEGVRERVGGHASADLVLRSVDFAEVRALQLADDWEGAGRLLGAAARGLVGAGAEVLLLCTGTMHLVAPTIEDAAGLPLLHIGDTTAAAVVAAGLRRVGLLGTAFTTERPFLRDRLAAHGLEVVVPGQDDRAFVDRVVFDELVHGIVREESRDRYAEVVARLAADDAEGVILGCTEIELLIGPDDSPVPLFPTTALHVDAALDAALPG